MSHPLFYQIFLLPHSLFFWVSSYVHVTPFNIVPQVLESLFFFFLFYLFSMCSSVFLDLVTFSSSSLILSSAVLSLLTSMSKVVFISVVYFLFLAFPFDSYIFYFHTESTSLILHFVHVFHYFLLHINHYFIFPL